MEKFGLLFASALAFLGLAACSDETEIYPGREEWQNEESCAAQATVTSSDANYVTGDNGGTISFKTEGGSATLTISCGCGWIAENSATDLFTTSASSTSLTITAGQNTVEEDLIGTITFMTETYRITFATVTIIQSAYGAPTITVETTEWNAPAVGALTTEIAVDASADWIAESSDDWLTVEKTGAGIILTAAENGETTERSTHVTLTCTDEIKSEYAFITVIQDGLAYISFGIESMRLASDECSDFVTVESNFNWDYTYDTTNGWFTVSKDSNGLTVTVVANTGDVRDGIVVVTAGDGAENVTEAQLTITQSGISDLILTYTITSANTKTQLPLYETIDCTVDWGDGTVETITSYWPSHTYAEAGEYDVTISGTVTALYSHELSTDANPLPITAVKQWGLTGLTSMVGAFTDSKLAAIPENSGDAFAKVTSFYAAFSHTDLKEIPAATFKNCPEATNFEYVFSTCPYLKIVPSGLFSGCPKATSFLYAFLNCSGLVEVSDNVFNSCTEVTEFSYAFYGCTSLTTIPTGMLDNLTKVENIDGLFYNCVNLMEIPKGLFDDLINIKVFYYSFYNCSNIKSIPIGLFDHCTKVTSFDCVFYSCSSLEEIPAGLFDNCTEVENFHSAFNHCEALKAIPNGLFDKCTKVTNFGTVFQGCYSITEIPKGLFDKNTAVTDFGHVFYNCKALESIPSGLFDNCPLVTKLEYCFGYASISDIPDGLFDNCPLVTSFTYAFYSCPALTKIPEGLFDNCPLVTSFSYAFYNCSSLTEIPKGLFDNCPLVTNFGYSFRGCTSLTGESPYDTINGVKVHLYERTNYPDIYTTPTSYGNCFTNCTGLTDYYSIPSSWGGGGN